MKELTKIRLINWHIFWNETIPVKGNILITGENATGKSTLIDAVFFVLTGGNDKSFNTAANSKAMRTLETYMRCKTGVEGKDFMRQDPNVISHIALEFFDTDEMKPFVIGVALEIRDNTSKPDQKFYHVPEGSIGDLCFFDGENIANFKALFDMSKNQGTDIEFIDGSKADIRRAISFILGISTEKYQKYNELLPKALAFRPITEVSQFVYNFLFPEKNVNLERIREDIKEFREIQDLIERDQAKQDDLSIICTKGDELKGQISEKNLLNAYLKKMDLDSLSRELSSIDNQITTAKHRKNELEKQISDQDEMIETVNRKKYEIQNSDAFKVMRENEIRLESARKEEEDLSEREQILNKKLRKLSSSALNLGIKNTLCDIIEKADFTAMTEEVQRISTEVSDLKNSVQLQLNGLYSQKERITENLQNLENSRNELKKGLHPYPEKVRSLLEYIKSGLEKITGKSEDVRPLCEFLEIDSKYENWRNTIEGALNKKRFDLVVSSRLFEKASELYEKFNNDGNCADIGIINGSIKAQPKEKSLATMIVTEDERARNYIDFILGNIIAKDSEDGITGLLSNEGSANLKSMFYVENATRQASFDIYGTPYIGTKSIQLQLEIIEKTIDQLKKQLESFTLQIGELVKKQQTANELNFFSILDERDIWQLHYKCVERINMLEEENKKFRDNSSDLFSRLDELDEKLNYEKQRKQQLENEKTKQIESIGSLFEKQNARNEKYKELTSLFEELSKNRELMICLEEFEHSEKKSKKECEAKARMLEVSIPKLESLVCEKMSKYIETYSFDSRPELSSLDDFYNELNQVIGRHLVQFKEKADQAELNCRRGFQDSYIAEIRKYINDEKENINRLNRILSTKPFGNESEIYRFEVSKSKNPDFGIYYDVFTSNQDFNVNELFTDALSAENSSLLNELFERITKNPESEKEERLLKEYTDYRNFMSYDIKITNNRGEVSYFSKINREKSGGETQTPFYVIIAASFDQLSRSSSNDGCGCVIILDEAFNNMDEGRISSMMEYFKQLKIQLMIVVPPERFRTIFRHVDTTIALSKSNNRAIVLTLSRNEL